MTGTLPCLDQLIVYNSSQLQVFSQQGYIHEEDAR